MLSSERIWFVFWVVATSTINIYNHSKVALIEYPRSSEAQLLQCKFHVIILHKFDFIYLRILLWFIWHAESIIILIIFTENVWNFKMLLVQTDVGIGTIMCVQTKHNNKNKSNINSENNSSYLRYKYNTIDHM